jgi:hypothetical protein
MSFFALALVGWACGASPLPCALKALGGAAVVYVLVTVLVRVMVKMIVDTMMEGPGRTGDKESGT